MRPQTSSEDTSIRAYTSKQYEAALTKASGLCEAGGRGHQTPLNGVALFALSSLSSIQDMNHYDGHPFGEIVWFAVVAMAKGNC